MVEHADEVRDRAAMYLHALNIEEKSPIKELAFGDSSDLNITALESFLLSNKEQLISSDKALQIDLSSLKQEQVKTETMDKQ